MDLLYTRVDRAALAHNISSIKNYVGETALMAVVKADAYNHGADEVARIAVDNGATELGVATIAEALDLREKGIHVPILAWIWTVEQDYNSALDENIRLGISNLQQIHALCERAQKGHTVTVDIKIDTGLCRSGLNQADWQHAFDLLLDPQYGIHIGGLFSHLSSADDVEDSTTDQQKIVFEKALAQYDKVIEHYAHTDPHIHERAGQKHHIANSAATLSRPDLHYSMVRVGIALYGLSPFDTYRTPIELKPAMSWCAHVSVVKKISEGDRVSYSHTWTAPHDGYIAIIPVGYADGLARSVQGHLEISIGGKKYPQVGRVCMDQCVIFLGEDSHIQPGDQAIIFGTEGMSATDIARAIGTINYEIVCMPHGRTQRYYI